MGVGHHAALGVLRRSPPAWQELGEDVDGVPHTADVAAQREELRALMKALEDLPERQRRALVLRECEGRSWREVADALGTGEGAVRQLLFRAREQLRAGVAVVVAPVWLLRAERARAALASIGAVKAIAGSAAGVVALGGGIVVLRHHGTDTTAVAHASVAPAVASAPADPADAFVVTDNPAPSEHATRDRRKPRVRHAHPSGRPARVSHDASSHTVDGPTPTHGAAGEPNAVHRPQRQAPAAGGAEDHPAAGGGSGTSGAGGATGDGPPTSTTDAGSTGSAAPGGGDTPGTVTSGPAPGATTATTDTTTPTTPSATTPSGGSTLSGPAPPPVIGTVSRYQQSASFGGPLDLALGTTTVSAYFGELTILRCHVVRDGVEVAVEPCDTLQLVAGAQVTRAEHGLNGSGHDVWTTVELLLQG